MVETNRIESDVQVRHCDQTRHCDVHGKVRDKDGLQVISVALAASPEEGVLWVWRQMETGSC